MVIGVNTFIKGEGIYYEGVLRDVKKSRISLQPVFEAFTNALEAIKIRTEKQGKFEGKVEIEIYSTQNTDNSLSFAKLIIKDNGVGFNDDEFRRFNTYKDFTKGFTNFGSGRIQYAHYFDSTNVVSIYNAGGEFRRREFIVSKSSAFLKNNTIVLHKDDIPVKATDSQTVLTFDGLLEPKGQVYNNLNHKIFKEKLLQRYIQYFCLNKETLPLIYIRHYIFNELNGETEITSSDIPDIDKTKTISLPYSKLSTDGKSIVKAESTEDFIINAFKMPKSSLNENSIKLTSKDEVIEQLDIELNLLSKEENVDNYRYLFLVSSDFIDARDANERGEIDIPDLDQFTKNASLFREEEILLNDIKTNINESIVELYPEIERVKEEHEINYQKLKQMFLLPDDFDAEINISVNDSEKKILEKFYVAEAKRSASLDASLKNSIDRLNSLDTTSPEYFKELEVEVDKLVRCIPQQNKVDLTHYVARRKLVLELFSKIIDRQLVTQNDGSRNKDEALLHNLIFQQASSNPNKSDLWLVNEDFIYFKGISESKLSDVVYDGRKIIRESLSEEEEEFRQSLGEDRYAKRPDILLFPQESKCIIIEFKNPNVSVSDHLNQINNYATLLLNFTVPEFKFTTFYGYLIGEKINAHDVRSYDADFKNSFHFDYLFRPSKTVAGMFNNEGKDGNLYTEVIKYSTLLQRAKQRNEIFIENITSKSSSDDAK